MSMYCDTITDEKLNLLARSVRKLTKRLDEAGLPPYCFLTADELATCMELSAAYPESPTAEEGDHN